MQPNQLRLLAGIVAVLIALLAALNNGAEAVVMLIGPNQLEAMSAGQPKFVQDSMMPLVSAMRSPVHRWVTLAMALVGLLAAGALGFGGLALIAEQRAARWLLASWGWYGVVAGPILTWLSMTYLMPQIAMAEGQVLTRGMMVGQGLLSLLLMWVLPVTLLIVLRRPILWRGFGAGGAVMAREPGAGQRWAVGSTPERPSQAPRPLPVPTGDADPARTAAAQPEPPNFAQRYGGLRDDPWNDPTVT